MENKNIWRNTETYKYRGLLLLYPIDYKYKYIIEKNFNIYNVIEISINNQDFFDLLITDTNYTKQLTIDKVKENNNNNKLCIYFIIDVSCVYVNEVKKK